MPVDETPLTELVDLEVLRQDGVRTPASGFRFIVQKDVNAVGGIDERPDIMGAESVLCQLYKLVEAEAREGAIGADESADIQCLAEAISLIRYFKANEEWGLCDDGEMCKSALEPGLVFKAHRKFSSDERKSLASEGKALEDGSYPIPDEDALHRAAILAKSHHGDWKAAERLIAKRAKELGVSNPLASDTQKDTEGVVPEAAPETSPEATAPEGSDDSLTKDVVAKMIADALEAGTSPLREERDNALKELEVLKAKPIPGGPALIAPADARAIKVSDEVVKKAAHYDNLAKTVTDPDARAYYREKAAAFKKQLAAA